MAISLSGKITVMLTSPDPTQSIRRIIDKGIRVSDLAVSDPLTVTFQIQRQDLSRLRSYAEKHDLTLRIIRRRGLFWKVALLQHRPILITGLATLLMLFWILSGRILLIEVEGNHTLTDRLILEAAAESGIRFGARTRQVRSEKVKNALLSQLPHLQWAGVNTYGSRAVITVRERAMEETPEAKGGVSSIVAHRDGIILSCTVTRGTSLVVPGQAVTAGQTLISGYTDCGISIEATRAEGEVYGATSRELTVVSPVFRQRRVMENGKFHKISLVIGKKRINFFKGSGISPVSCVKMYREYVLTLPGGFQLPAAIILESASQYSLQETLVQTPKAQLSDFAKQYLKRQMIAGKITGCVETFRVTDVCLLTGRYSCEELIGRDKVEQIGVYHGKTD